MNQQHVTQLQQVFAQGGNIDKQRLTQTITSMAPSGRVSQEYVTRFVTDLSTVAPKVQLNAQAQQRLATAVAYVLAPTAMPSQLETTLTEVRQVLVQSGLSPIAAQTIACDLHLLAAETHPNLLEVQVRP